MAMSLCPNVVNVIICYLAECGSQTSAHSGLLTVENSVVPYDVVADGFFVPAVLEGTLNGFDIAFSGIGRFIIPLVAVFPERDS